MGSAERSIALLRIVGTEGLSEDSLSYVVVRDDGGGSCATRSLGTLPWDEALRLPVLSTKGSLTVSLYRNISPSDGEQTEPTPGEPGAHPPIGFARVSLSGVAYCGSSRSLKLDGVEDPSSTASIALDIKLEGDHPTEAARGPGSPSSASLSPATTPINALTTPGRIDASGEAEPPTGFLAPDRSVRADTPEQDASRDAPGVGVMADETDRRREQEQRATSDGDAELWREDRNWLSRYSITAYVDDPGALAMATQGAEDDRLDGGASEGGADAGETRGGVGDVVGDREQCVSGASIQISGEGQAGPLSLGPPVEYDEDLEDTEPGETFCPPAEGPSSHDIDGVSGFNWVNASVSATSDEGDTPTGYPEGNVRVSGRRDNSRNEGPRRSWSGRDGREEDDREDIPSTEDDLDQPSHTLRMVLSAPPPPAPTSPPLAPAAGSDGGHRSSPGFIADEGRPDPGNEGAQSPSGGLGYLPAGVAGIVASSSLLQNTEDEIRLKAMETTLAATMQALAREYSSDLAADGQISRSSRSRSRNSGSQGAGSGCFSDSPLAGSKSPLPPNVGVISRQRGGSASYTSISPRSSPQNPDSDGCRQGLTVLPLADSSFGPVSPLPERRTPGSAAGRPGDAPQGGTQFIWRDVGSVGFPSPLPPVGLGNIQEFRSRRSRSRSQNQNPERYLLRTQFPEVDDRASALIGSSEKSHSVLSLDFSGSRSRSVNQAQEAERSPCPGKNNVPGEFGSYEQRESSRQDVSGRISCLVHGTTEVKETPRAGAATCFQQVSDEFPPVDDFELGGRENDGRDRRRTAAVQRSEHRGARPRPKGPATNIDPRTKKGERQGRPKAAGGGGARTTVGDRPAVSGLRSTHFAPGYLGVAWPKSSEDGHGRVTESGGRMLAKLEEAAARKLADLAERTRRARQETAERHRRRNIALERKTRENIRRAVGQQEHRLRRQVEAAQRRQSQVEAEAALIGTSSGRTGEHSSTSRAEAVLRRRAVLQTEEARAKTESLQRKGNMRAEAVLRSLPKSQALHEHEPRGKGTAAAAAVIAAATAKSATRTADDATWKSGARGATVCGGASRGAIESWSMQRRAKAEVARQALIVEQAFRTLASAAELRRQEAVRARRERARRNNARAEVGRARACDRARVRAATNAAQIGARARQSYAAAALTSSAEAREKISRGRARARSPAQRPRSRSVAFGAAERGRVESRNRRSVRARSHDLDVWPEARNLRAKKGIQMGQRADTRRERIGLERSGSDESGMEQTASIPGGHPFQEPKGPARRNKAMGGGTGGDERGKDREAAAEHFRESRDVEESRPNAEGLGDAGVENARTQPSDRGGDRTPGGGVDGREAGARKCKVQIPPGLGSSAEGEDRHVHDLAGGVFRGDRIMLQHLQHLDELTSRLEDTEAGLVAKIARLMPEEARKGSGEAQVAMNDQGARSGKMRESGALMSIRATEGRDKKHRVLGSSARASCGHPGLRRGRVSRALSRLAAPTISSQGKIKVGDNGEIAVASLHVDHMRRGDGASVDRHVADDTGRRKSGWGVGGRIRCRSTEVANARKRGPVTIKPGELPSDTGNRVPSVVPPPAAALPDRDTRFRSITRSPGSLPSNREARLTGCREPPQPLGRSPRRPLGTVRNAPSMIHGESTGDQGRKRATSPVGDAWRIPFSERAEGIDQAPTDGFADPSRDEGSGIWAWATGSGCAGLGGFGLQEEGVVLSGHERVPADTRGIRAESESLESEIATLEGESGRSWRTRRRRGSADVEGVAAREGELDPSADDRASVTGLPSGPWGREEDPEPLSRQTRRVTGTEDGVTSMPWRLRDGEALSPSFRRLKPPSPHLGVGVGRPALGFEGAERELKRREAGKEKKEEIDKNNEKEATHEEEIDEEGKAKVSMQASPARREGKDDEEQVVDRATYGREGGRSNRSSRRVRHGTPSSVSGSTAANVAALSDPRDTEDLPSPTVKNTGLSEQVSVLADLEARITSLGGLLATHTSSASSLLASPRMVASPRIVSSSSKPERSPRASNDPSPCFTRTLTGQLHTSNIHDSGTSSNDERPRGSNRGDGRFPREGRRRRAHELGEPREDRVSTGARGFRVEPPRMASRAASDDGSISSSDLGGPRSITSTLASEVEALLRGGSQRYGIDSAEDGLYCGRWSTDAAPVAHRAFERIIGGDDEAGDFEQWEVLEDMAERLGVLADSHESALGSSSRGGADSVSSFGGGDVGRSFGSSTVSSVRQSLRF